MGDICPAGDDPKYQSHGQRERRRVFDLCHKSREGLFAFIHEVEDDGLPRDTSARDHDVLLETFGFKLSWFPTFTPKHLHRQL